MRFLLLALALLAAAATARGASEVPVEARQSGYALMGRETRAMQDDDASNPGMLWVLEGESLWNAKAGTAGRSCANCHGDTTQSMRGVAARHPQLEPRSGALLNLAQRINACRVERQQAKAYAFESRPLLALEAYLGRQSRGMPIDIADDALVHPLLEAGRTTFNRRMGQVNLSCAQCHDARAGLKLAGNTIPQAHPTGYPLYRLEWQSLGSLGRRIRNCMIGTRAEPFAYGSKEMVELEVYLLWRARGMPLETPAVRP